jgi:biotin carboxyl carrier protein
LTTASIKAILPGTVCYMHVDDGAEVEEGQEVIAIECMKQETAMTAPASGRVKFAVQLGEIVEQDQVIAEIETE